jgi:CheY-like chemotaxis protein
MQVKKRILIVDDDELVCGAIQRLLEEHGHVASCCCNGTDAIKLSKKRNYDVIITDYNMPGMNGDMVCRLLRHHNPGIYIIGCSSEQRDQDFLNAGADAFILKDQLFQNLVSLMNNSPAERIR